MKKSIKAVLLSGLTLLFAGNAWALPIQVGDTVKMELGNIYTMTVIDTGESYNSFCVEKYEYFVPGDKYLVDSVVDYANEGGGSTALGAINDVTTEHEWRDYISEQTIWLYASYFSNGFGVVATEDQVQNAIWFSEDEITNPDDYNYLISGRTNFDVTGWDIKVVNLSSGDLKQSQLIGTPVPESATMVLFGIGILGLAGIGRKKYK